MHKILLTALALPALLLLSPTARSADDKPALEPGKWVGEPTVQIGKTIAALGWQDGNGGLHLRVTAPPRKDKLHHYTGTVCALGKKDSNKITTLTPVLLEKGQDSAKIGPKGHCIWFSFKTGGHVDGFDFTTPAKHLLFTIKLDGQILDTQKIHIGALNNHPAANPVVLRR